MAMNVGGKSEGEVMSDINVTPLVDVMLVLLIIFIITIPVIVAQVHLNLPKATNLPTQTKPENITISVDKEGNMYWNTKLLPNIAALKDELRGIARIDPSPKCTSAAIRTCAISTSARCSSHRSRSVSAKWRLSPNPIISASSLARS